MQDMKRVMIFMMALALSACSWAPGMKFNKRAASSSYQTKVVQQGQYKIRIVPITRKLLYLQKVQQQRLAQPKSSAANSIHSNYTYRVGAGDVLSIQLWEDESLLGGTSDRSNSKGAVTVVDSKGYIYFPYAGEVYVKGSSLPEIRRKIHQNMLEYFDNPKVTVLITDYNSQYAMVTGQVSIPGRRAITAQPLTVFSAIYVNGGGGALADGLWRKATLTRANGKVLQVNLVNLVSKGDFSQDYVLRHGDRLHVPLAQGEKAFLLGGGVQARTLVLQNTDTSLSEALGDVGGLTDDANTKAVYVFRREPGRPANEVTAYNLDATSPVSLLMAADFKLRPKDIVYVDTAGIVRWNRVISLLIPSAGVPTNLSSIADDVQEIAN